MVRELLSCRRRRQIRKKPIIEIVATAPTPMPIPAFAAKESSLLGPDNAVLDDAGLGVAAKLGVAAELVVDVRVVLFGFIILQ